MSESIDFSKLSINRLEETEHIESFNCGDSDLNDFILSESQLYQVALLAVTYVAKIENRVISYFSLANDRVSLGDFERNNFSPMQPNDNDEHTRLYYFDLNDYKDFLNSNIVL